MKIRIELEGEASTILSRPFLPVCPEEALSIVSRVADLEDGQFTTGGFISDRTGKYILYKIFKA